MNAIKHATQPRIQIVLYPHMTKTFALMALDKGILIFVLPRGFRFPRRFAHTLFPKLKKLDNLISYEG